MGERKKHRYWSYSEVVWSGILLFVSVFLSFLYQSQTQRLCESEAKLNDSHYAMENISTSNHSLQRKLSSLQRDREDTLTEKMETMRQRQVLESK